MFVGKDQNDGITHLAVVDDSMQFLPSFINTIAIGAVYHVDQTLCAGVVMTP